MLRLRLELAQQRGDQLQRDDNADALSDMQSSATWELATMRARAADELDELREELYETKEGAAEAIQAAHDQAARALGVRVRVLTLYA